ncbi:MAG: CHASE2 domain-containing protein, partial [Bacteriovoracaceae bacterium]|nr:CHASE2 domain-containing protein [Bacteriovoracaceae bacterium]
MSLNSFLRYIGHRGHACFVALQKLGPIKYYPLIFTLIALCFLTVYRGVELEAFFYDAAIKYDPHPPSLAPFRFVLLNEDSDELLGESFPYSYFGHLRMLRRLFETKPRMVISCVPFLAPRNAQQMQDMQAVHDLIQQYRQAGGEFYFALDYGTWAMQPLPEIFQDVPQLFAVINADESNFAQDQVVRRTLLQVGPQTTLHLLLANRERAKQGRAPLRPSEVHGHTYLPSTDAHYALARMRNLPYFDQDFQVANFFEMVNGRFAAADWQDTIVFYGPHYTSRSEDFVKTPFSRHQSTTAKLLVHAQMMAALVENKGVAVAPRGVSAGIMWLVALLLMGILLQARPRQTLVWPLACLLLVLLTSAFSLYLGGI